MATRIDEHTGTQDDELVLPLGVIEQPCRLFSVAYVLHDMELIKE